MHLASCSILTKQRTGVLFIFLFLTSDGKRLCVEGRMGSSSSVLDVVDAFKTLRSRDIALDDHSFWKPFFTSNVSPVDLFAIVTPKLLRDLRRTRPSSLASLLYKCTEQLMVFASLGSKIGEPKSVLNALAILARVLPFALEPPQQLPPQLDTGISAGGDRVGGGNGSVTVGGDVATSSSPFYENFPTHVFLGNLRCLPDGSQFPPLPGGESLNVALMKSIVDLCFIPGFSIGPYQQPSKRTEGVAGGDRTWPADVVDPALLWGPGLGSVPSLTYPSPDTTSSHRRAILSTLLVLLSVPLYIDQPICPEPLFRDLLTLGIPSTVRHDGEDAGQQDCVPLPLSATFFASLWNTVTSYDPRGSLPYTSHFVSEHESLVCIAAQVLGACLDYSPLLLQPPPPVPREPGSSGGVETPSVSLLASTAWKVLITCSEAQAAELLAGLCRLIENNTYARSTYLPKSQRPFPMFDELVMLLWKLIDRAPPFLRALSDGGSLLGPAGGFQSTTQQSSVSLGLSILVPLMDFAYAVRERPQQSFQQLQIVLFILQRVTVERDYCLLCNTPFKQFLPFPFPAFAGTYNDFIVIGMTTLMQLPPSTHAALQPFHESMAHVISNVSPFMTTVSSLTAEKLVRVVQHWGSAAVLRPNTTTLTNPVATGSSSSPQQPAVVSPDVDSNRNPYTLALVVEAIATLLQYQYPGSFPLAAELAKNEVHICRLAEDYRTLALPLPERLRGKLLIPTLYCASVCIAEALRKATSGGKSLALSFQQGSGDASATQSSFVRQTTLVGSLPIPHQIICRRVESGYNTDAWLTKVFWGAVFLHSIPGTLVDYKSIRLFATATP